MSPTPDTGNGWRAHRVTLGVLVTLAVGSGAVVGAISWTSEKATAKIHKEIKTHDDSAHCHPHIQAKIAKARQEQAHAAKETRTELRHIRELVVRQKTMLEVVLKRRGRSP
jgi:hypothetical protein